MFSKVAGAKVATIFFKKPVNYLGNFTFIKLITASFGNFLQGIGQIRISKDFSFLRHPTVWIVMLFDIGEGPVSARYRLKRQGKFIMHRKSLVSIPDGMRKDFLHGQITKFFV